MMRTLLLVFITIALMLQSCATTKNSGEMPDWVNSQSRQFPTSQYLIGRGEHKKRSIARDRARADLAKIFQIAVDEQSRDIVKYSSKNIGKDTISHLESEASRDITTRTEQVMNGVEISDNWHDPKTSIHHALATINRLQASNRLRREISDLDGVTGQYLSKAQNSRDLITRIGLATRAVTTQVERDSSQRILKIIDRSGVGVPSTYNLGKLVGDRDSLVKRLRVAPKASQDDLGDAERLVSGALARVGFSHSRTEKANYILDVQVKMQPPENREGWIWLRGALDINLLDAKNNESRGTHRWDIKVSGQTNASARKRAQSEIDRILKKELRQTIISFGKPE